MSNSQDHNRPMTHLLALHSRLRITLIRVMLRMTIAIDDHRRWADKRGRKLVGSLRRLHARWLPAPTPR
jgi:hypothetical protein